MISRKRWNILPPDPQLQILLSDGLGIDPILAQILINRGIQSSDEAKLFLWADDQSLHDPFLLQDMQKAIARLHRAKENHEKV
ncbi:MAG: single-stranded-DNA-specific exonuclease RecJ, partial [Candidatus Omnitrophica bacterium]|nr:single-stranded-DNA-specific exonuclease RecJ [Candidatus Omnitrophota bacterium]